MRPPNVKNPACRTCRLLTTSPSASNSKLQSFRPPYSIKSNSDYNFLILSLQLKTTLASAYQATMLSNSSDNHNDECVI